MQCPFAKSSVDGVDFLLKAPSIFFHRSDGATCKARSETLDGRTFLSCEVKTHFRAQLRAECRRDENRHTDNQGQHEKNIRTHYFSPLDLLLVAFLTKDDRPRNLRYEQSTSSR